MKMIIFQYSYIEWLQIMSGVGHMKFGIQIDSKHMCEIMV